MTVETVEPAGYVKWREQLHAHQAHLKMTADRRYAWLRTIEQSMHSAACALSRSEMRDLVTLALSNGCKNHGGSYPSGTTVSYSGTAQFSAFGVEWTATGTKDGGQWDDRMWIRGTDGYITIEGGGRKYVINQIPEYTSGWWDYLVEGDEGLLGAL